MKYPCLLIPKFPKKVFDLQDSPSVLVASPLLVKYAVCVSPRLQYLSDSLSLYKQKVFILVYSLSLCSFLALLFVSHLRKSLWFECHKDTPTASSNFLFVINRFLGHLELIFVCYEIGIPFHCFCIWVTLTQLPLLNNLAFRCPLS